MAQQFVLVRITRMRDVNLALFDFDYDLTWMDFFLNAQEKIYGRYGGREAESADGRVSLAGLRYALEAARKRHRSERNSAADAPRTPAFASDFPAFQRLPANACVHCHQVYDLRRESLQKAGKWSLDEVWVHPQPENIGLTLDIDRGDRVSAVAVASPADRAGIRPGDRISSIGAEPVASIADVQYALHRRRADRLLSLKWWRGDHEMSGSLTLAEGWHKSDLSWRWSLRGIDPVPPLRGDDLTVEEKAALGMRPARLAFRQGPFESAEAEQAGIRQNDVIVGIDGREPDMTARQFGAYIRLNYKVGDRVSVRLLRARRQIDTTITLAGHGS